jgi:hypothetical protein
MLSAMRTRLLGCLLLVSAVAFGRPQTRAVVIDTVCETSVAHLLPIINRFCYEFQACPDSLFSWAYMGTGELEVADSDTKESRDVIQLDYKDRAYDPATKTGEMAIDIYVLGVRWWKDQHLGTQYTLTRPVNARYPLTAHLSATYSGSILECGNVIFRMEPVSPTRTHVHYEFSLTFGRVLSAFIGDKTWRNAIQWRFETILANLIEYAETGTVLPKETGPKK